jgi:NAD(P)-dependent dehydrogenase (short-subunit alcohol dehydrogenase family)
MNGPIDVLVNNAGIGLFGAFEATPMSTVREVFETNTFGVMAMTQAVLPQFRARRSGVVVNVTSSATLAPAISSGRRCGGADPVKASADTIEARKFRLIVVALACSRLPNQLTSINHGLPDSNANLMTVIPAVLEREWKAN